MKWIGSIYWAIFFIALLAVLLVISTTLESIYGTPFAQKTVYQANWFDALLALLAVNITASTLSRWPFKKRHTGFIVTHAGILVLLAGSLITRVVACEGQMLLYEGQARNDIQQNFYQIVLHQSDGRVLPFPVPSHSSRFARPLTELKDGSKIYLNRVSDNAVVHEEITEGGPDAPVNYAVHLTLKSEKMGVENSFWLIQNNPGNPDPAQFSMGPALISLKDRPEPKKDAKQPDTAPQLLFKPKGGDPVLVDISRALKDKEMALGQSGFTISGLRYLPDAKVGPDNKLISASDKPLNPAVEFDLKDASGQSHRYVKFALYPDFETMHAKKSPAVFDGSIEFTAPQAAHEHSAEVPSLTLYSNNGQWAYESRMPKSQSPAAQGPLKPGQIYPAQWMDFTFQADKIYSRAVVSKTASPAQAGQRGELAVEISLARDKNTVERVWVFENSPRTFNAGGDPLIVALSQKTVSLPFSLTLKEFRKVDYPGTRRPASYESDVLLRDDAENVSITQTIKMNRPLDYKGWRVFQSSYIEDSPNGKASIFTIARNPGIALIYWGSGVLFLGIFVTFFVPVFSSLTKN